MRRGKLTIEVEVEGDLDSNFLGSLGNEGVRYMRGICAGSVGGPPAMTRASWFTEMHEDKLEYSGCRWLVPGYHQHEWTLYARSRLSDDPYVADCTELMAAGQTPLLSAEYNNFKCYWRESCQSCHLAITYEPFFDGVGFMFSEKEAP